MKIYFATQNKHKFAEARAILSRYGIEIEQLAIEKQEADASDVVAVARREALRIANISQKAVVVDDTGVFFDAIPGFPGAQPKRVFEALGYDGLFKKLEGKVRTAQFVCCVAYCEPGKKPLTFIGELKGEVIFDVRDQNKDVLPYERIFIPHGETRTLSAMSREEKNSISHRAKAFEGLAEYLKKNLF